jgi:hypothetical protein
MAGAYPNIEDSPQYDAMAVRDSTDLYALTCGASGTGVISGMVVTQDTGSDMNVQVSAGSVVVNGQPATLTTAWTSPTITAANTGDRRDVVIYRLNVGCLYITGTPCSLTSANWTRTANQNPPIKPNIIPATDVVLAEVYVAGSGGTATTAIVGTVAGVNGGSTTTDGSTGAAITGNIVGKLTALGYGGQVYTRSVTYQNSQRRGGSVGAATAGDSPSQFPFGQVDIVMGDSIAAEAGASTPGVTGWATVLANTENRSMGLPDPGPGFVYGGVSGANLYNMPAFSSSSNGTLVAGYVGSLVQSGAGGLGVQLTGTINNVSSIVGDNRPFRRVLVFYKYVSGSDGLGVSLNGGSTFPISLDPNNASAGSPGSGTDHAVLGTIKCWDSGDITDNPAITPALQFKRITAVSGGGGTAPTVIGYVCYGPHNPGTTGSIVHNIGVSATATGDWLSNRTWENHLGLVNGIATVRRIHIRLVANDYLLSRSVSNAAFNNSTTLTSATAQFSQGDVGRPITGNANIPGGTTIASVTNATTITMSNSSTGGSLTSQTVNFGIIPVATSVANLTTVIQRAQIQCPLSEIVLGLEYHVGGPTRPYPLSQYTYATQWAPLIVGTAYSNNCTLTDEYARWGSIGVLTSFSDCTLTTGSPTITSTATAQFTSADLGTNITGTNILPGTTILAVASTTSATMSSNALGSASGTYKIGGDIHGIGYNVDHTHLGDSTNSSSGLDGQRAHGEFVYEETSYGENFPYATPAVTQITSTATTTWLCPKTGLYRITCVGGGGSGGGGGSPTNASATTQVGGGGGGQGENRQQVQTLTAGVLYALTIGLGGAQVAGGAGNGLHAGTSGNAGGNTTFSGATTIVASGGGSGTGGAGNSTTDVQGGAYGGGANVVGYSVLPGFGGTTFHAVALGLAGGAGVGYGPGGGAAGASASSTLGGNAGLGAVFTAANVNSSGNTASSAGGGGGTGGQPGGGGGGGGGGAGVATSGAGGTGGAGGNGAIYIEKVG